MSARLFNEESLPALVCSVSMYSTIYMYFGQWGVGLLRPHSSTHLDNRPGVYMIRGSLLCAARLMLPTRRRFIPEVTVWRWHLVKLSACTCLAPTRLLADSTTPSLVRYCVAFNKICCCPCHCNCNVGRLSRNGVLLICTWRCLSHHLSASCTGLWSMHLGRL